MNTIKSQFYKRGFRYGLLVLAAMGFFEVGVALAVPALPVINTNNIITITSAPYNAVGDGVTTNTSAIQAAINAAALGGTTNGAAGGTVEIPAGVYLSGPFTLKSKVNLQLDGGAILRMLPFTSYPKLFITNVTPFFVTNMMIVTTNFSTNITWTATNFISGKNLGDLEISGSGMIQGQGEPWWPYANTNGDTRPIMISLSGCSRTLIQNLTLSNSPEFHIAISGGNSDTTVQGVTIRANSSSDPVNPGHNTDACDVSGSHILIQNNNISVGDDNYTCSGGTSDVLITNNTYGNGHGVSIGSFTSPNVLNMTVINCTFTNEDAGIRIKSDRDRGGFVDNICYYNLSMTNVRNPILIYTEYTNTTPAYRALDSISPNVAASYSSAPVVIGKTPMYRDITISNITANAQANRAAGLIWGLPELSVSNVTLVNVHLIGSKTFGIYDAKNVRIIDTTHSVPNGVSQFSLYNTDITFSNSVPSAALVTLDGATTNGVRNKLSLFNAKVTLKNTNAIDGAPLAISASTLTISNHFNFAASSTVSFTLGTNAATIVVTSNLFLGGTINIKTGDGFTNTTYTLFTYKNLSWGPPTLGSTPGGYAYNLDTNTLGQVNLVVQSLSLSAPSAPTNVAALATNSNITLSWSPVAAAATYNVKRSTDEGGPYPTVFSGISSTNYTDTLVTNGTAYYYVISAVNSGGESSNSVQVSATAEASTVTNTPALFSDTFASGSTLNSVSPAAPTATSTAYEIVSSKSWNPAPGISSGHLQFGIGATTSGSIEVQSLFNSTPSSLASVGDSITLTVVFTDTSGILTQTGVFGLGLFNTGGNFPVPGGMNATATTSFSDHTAGNAQTWAGYVGQISFTGGNSRIMTRESQSGTGNNNQDLVTSGSGSSSYANPAAATIDFQNAAGVTLAAGAQYTAVLTIALSASNTLAITNSLYAGNGTNGTLVTRFGGVALGATYLTGAFDGLAIGWRATVNTSANAMDINQIKVSFTPAPQTQPSQTPPMLVYEMVGDQLQLSWPSDHLGWRLEIQTNDLNTGLGTNWFTVPDSTNVVQTNLVIDPANGTVFLRLVSP